MPDDVLAVTSLRQTFIGNTCCQNLRSDSTGANCLYKAQIFVHLHLPLRMACKDYDFQSYSSYGHHADPETAWCCPRADCVDNQLG